MWLLSRLHKSGSISSPGWRRSSVTPRVTTFPCPGCQHDIDLGERGISMLFRNFTLESIVERYRQAARAAVAIMCNVCKPPVQEATKSCMDCKASYCNECFKMHHPWGTPKAQHEYVGPTTNFRPKVWQITIQPPPVFWECLINGTLDARSQVLMCPEHEMEKVNMYCEVCRRPVCHLCKLGGSHANHKVTSMSSAYKILKVSLFPPRCLLVFVSFESLMLDLKTGTITFLMNRLKRGGVQWRRSCIRITDIHVCPDESFLCVTGEAVQEHPLLDQQRRASQGSDFWAAGVDSSDGGKAELCFHLLNIGLYSQNIPRVWGV